MPVCCLHCLQSLLCHSLSWTSPLSPFYQTLWVAFIKAGVGKLLQKHFFCCISRKYLNIPTAIDTSNALSNITKRNHCLWLSLCIHCTWLECSTRLFWINCLVINKLVTQHWKRKCSQNVQALTLASQHQVLKIAMCIVYVQYDNVKCFLPCEMSDSWIGLAMTRTCCTHSTLALSQ